jgi:hypothetical protein
MSESAIVQTMGEMLDRLKESVQTRNDAARQVVEYTNAIKALAQACSDEETRDYYLVSADELSGKPAFLEPVRSVLRLPGPQKSGLTPGEVKDWIVIGHRMDLSIYSNPIASIRTTLGRTLESGEVEQFLGAKGETRYRVVTRRIQSDRQGAAS